MHNQAKHKDRFKLKDKEHWLAALELALIQNLGWWSLRLELAPSTPRVLAPRTRGLSEK
jgi:hypothetical protein